jgi:hypothetical protein
MKCSVLKCSVTTLSFAKLYSIGGWWLNMKRWCTNPDGVKPTHWEKHIPVSLVDHKSNMEWPRIESGPAPSHLSYGTARLLRRTFCFRALIGRTRGWGLMWFLITSCNFWGLHSFLCHVASVYRSHFFLLYLQYQYDCRVSITLDSLKVSAN